jgi:hypothetical protein
LFAGKTGILERGLKFFTKSRWKLAGELETVVSLVTLGGSKSPVRGDIVSNTYLALRLLTCSRHTALSHACGFAEISSPMIMPLRNPRPSELAAWILLALLVLIGTPLFLCMPLWADVTFYDLCARNLLSGGVHYRDVFDTNPPGMPWIHAAVRTCVGWGSEAMRAVDLMVVVGVIGLLLGWLRMLGRSREALVWTAVALTGFYFSTSEWCHCQRDIWSLLVVLVAIVIRRRQVVRLLSEGTSLKESDATSTSPRPLFVDASPGSFQTSLTQLAVWSLLEGLLWGASMWIKPFIIIICSACWLFTAIWVYRRAQRPWRRLAADGFGLLAGGLIVGIAGFIWLRETGAWPYFLQVFLEWDPEYYAAVHMTLAIQMRFLLSQLFPWGLVHLAAVPCAVWTLVRLFKSDASYSRDTTGFARGLLAVLYLAWLGQVLFFQKPFDYVLAPLPILGMAVLCAQKWTVPRRVYSCGLGVLAAFVVTAAIYHPLFDTHRLALWPRCWQEGSSAELRDRLALIDARNTTDWQDLARVRDYLAGLKLRDGELTCYNNSTLSLYFDLNLRPSTRYLLFDMLLNFFPSRREEIRRDLDASRQRYVVSDLRSVDLTRGQAAAQAPGQPQMLPPEFPGIWSALFPWNQRIVFRSGRYVVQQAAEPTAALFPVE